MISSSTLVFLVSQSVDSKPSPWRPLIHQHCRVSQFPVDPRRSEYNSSVAICAQYFVCCSHSVRLSVVRDATKRQHLIPLTPPPPTVILLPDTLIVNVSINVSYHVGAVSMIFLVFVSTSAMVIMAGTMTARCWLDSDPEKQAMMMVLGGSPRVSQYIYSIS